MNNRLIHSIAIVMILAGVLFASPVDRSVNAQESQPKARITQVDVSQFPRVTVYISVTDDGGFPWV